MPTDEEIRKFLIAQPIFSGVEPEDIEAFAVRCRMNVYPAGTLLLKQGQRGDVLMCLVSGTVHFRCRVGARSTTLAILREPALFSLGAIIEKTGAMADAFALDPVQIISVDGVVVRELMAANATFAANLAIQLSRNVRGFVQSVVEQKILTGPKRLANFLALEFERQGQKPEIDLPFQRQVIASLLGMTPENLSRAFDALGRHGVHNDRTRVVVGSIDALVAFAEG